MPDVASGPAVAVGPVVPVGLVGAVVAAGVQALASSTTATARVNVRPDARAGCMFVLLHADDAATCVSISSSAPPCRALAAASARPALAPLVRVERVGDRVAEQVEGEDRRHDREAGQGHDPR